MRNTTTRTIILAALVAVCATAPLRADATVRLRSRAVVDGRYVLLGDVASVDGPTETAERIERIHLGPAPDREKRYSRLYVERMLRWNGWSPDAVRVSGARQVLIVRDDRAGFGTDRPDIAPAAARRITPATSANRTPAATVEQHPDAKPTPGDIAEKREAEAFAAKKRVAETERAVERLLAAHIVKAAGGADVRVDARASRLQADADLLARAASMTLDRIDGDPLRGHCTVHAHLRDAAGERIGSAEARCEVEISAPTVTLVRAAARDQIITADMVRLIHRPLKANADTFTRIDDVTGKRVKHSLRAGEAPRLRDLEVVEAVERNTVVTVVARSGGFLVRDRGVALQGGVVGDLVAVMNPRSEKRYAARIVGEGRVELIQ